MSTAHLIGHIVHVIFARDSQRLKKEFPELPVDLHRIHVGYPTIRLCVYEDDGLPFGIAVAPAPGDVNGNGIAPGMRDVNHCAVVAERVRIPGPGPVRDALWGAGSDHLRPFLHTNCSG